MIKKFFLNIDRLLFRKKFYNLYINKIKENQLLSYESNFYDHGFITQYSKNTNSLINQLCDKYGTDKGETKLEGHPYDWLSHNYADFYELLFRCRRKDVKLLIECGLGTNNPKIFAKR